MVALTCKNCGGNILFDKEKFSYICDSCGRTQLEAIGDNEIICDGEQTTVETVEKYQHALQVMDTAVSENMFTMAAMLFDEAKGFLDSEQRAKECRNRAAELRCERLYSSALKYMNSFVPEQINKARETFISLGDYEQSRENAEKCLELYQTAVKNQPKPQEKKPSTVKKKRKLPIFIVILIIIVAVIMGNNLKEKAVYSADNISVEFVPQINGYLTEYSNRYVFNFSVTLKNDGAKDIESIEGIVAFINDNGEVIVDTAVSFSGNPIALRSGKSSKYSWELTVYSEDTARQLYTADFDDYVVEFDITSIRFSDGKTIEYD